MAGSTTNSTTPETPETPESPETPSHPTNGLTVIDHLGAGHAKIAQTSFTVTAVAAEMVRIKEGTDGELLELRLTGLTDPFGRETPIPIKLKGRNAYVFAEKVNEGDLVTITGRIESWKPNSAWILSLSMGNQGPDGGDPWTILVEGEVQSEAMVIGKIAGCSPIHNRGSKWYYTVYVAVQQGREAALVPVRVWNVEGEEFLKAIADSTPVEVHGTLGADVGGEEKDTLFAHVNMKTKVDGGWKILTDEEYQALVEPEDETSDDGKEQKADGGEPAGAPEADAGGEGQAAEAGQPTSPPDADANANAGGEGQAAEADQPTSPPDADANANANAGDGDGDGDGDDELDHEDAIEL